ncbi:PREDICTED: SET domain-containing protein 9 isoform X5 [Miniopterus natalensis]|uniref:SET domain-containing protein 9 isoform X5 n=1 Tax=Miniopterus natalensis TaxID=291302 RepID=UPI0007A6ECD4|nr:PREDICTED: SET domain-containing protein 9 isoform X5 [Miniopterus natalensis]
MAFPVSRTLRRVPGALRDKVAPDEAVRGALLDAFRALFMNDLGKQARVLTVLPDAVQSKYQDLLSAQHPRANLQDRRRRQSIFKPEEILCTVYQKYEPIFFQSIGNPFIFRCLDGILIDGNDKGISKLVYRSCSGRDRLGPLKMSDSTWLTSEMQNPLAVGQYVNNCSNATCSLLDRPANVCYQEWDVPAVFPVELKQYLPNTAYGCDQHSWLSRWQGLSEVTPRSPGRLHSHPAVSQDL